MKQYEVGETAVCYLEVKKDGAYYSPATSTKLDIVTPAGATDVDDASMVEEATGKFSYDYQTASKSVGIYTVRYTATDGTKITKLDDTFEIIA